MIIIQTNPLPLHLKSAFFGFNAKQGKIRNFARFQIVTYQEANLCNPFNLSDKDNAQCLATW